MSMKLEIVKNRLKLIHTELDESFEFPLIWLRDNCQCQECFDLATTSRKIDWESLSCDNANFRDARLEAAKKRLEITWIDDNSSCYDLSWLMERNFSKKNRDQYLNNIYRPPKKIWSVAQFESVFEKFDFNEVLKNDEVFLSWLEQMAVYGIALIENTPDNKDEVLKLAERVGFIKKTHFGDEFTVMTKKQTTSFAYTNSKLQLHVDIPYYDQMPGVNLLHCLTQSETGGVNTFVDGFHVAELLRQKNPRLFDVLVKTKVNLCDYGNEHESDHVVLLRAPIIEVDDNGAVTRINFSNTQRDSIFSESVDDVILWYEAIEKFVKIMHSGVAEFKLQQGHILTFDNMRVLHGRSAYVENPGNSRCLVGVYVDWDQMFLKWRVLKRKIQNN